MLTNQHNNPEYELCYCEPEECDTGDVCDFFSNAYVKEICKNTTEDCNGDLGGIAYYDTCGCIGGNTGINKCNEEPDPLEEEPQEEQEKTCMKICTATQSSTTSKKLTITTQTDETMCPCEEESKDPCDEISGLLTVEGLNSQFKILKEKLGEPREYGYTKNFNSNIYVEQELYKDDSGNTVSNMIGFTYTQNTKGVIHSHYEDVIINNGTETLTTIPTYSPNDIGTFLNMIDYVKTNSQNDISEMYTALTSPNGNFIIKFTGDDNDLAHNNSSALLDIRKEANLGKLDDIYEEDYINDANTYEAGLLNFIKNKMGVQGLSLYKVDEKGEVSEIKLKETNPKSDVKIKC